MITIPGFYDDVLEVSAEERAKMAKAPFNLENYKKSLDIKEVKGEEGFTTNERTGIRPTFDVCGIWGGYTVKVPRQYCLLKHTPRSVAVWFRTRSTKKIGKIIQGIF